MTRENDKSASPESPLAAMSIFARIEIIWFEVFAAAALILSMETKTIHRFVSYAGPASGSISFDLIVALLYPLMIAGLAVIVFLSIRRLLSTVAEGTLILRIVVFQGLLLLNVALLGMDTMRY